jgi:hypothetical protein
VKNRPTRIVLENRAGERVREKVYEWIKEETERKRP